MTDLQGFFANLLVREGQSPIKLISAWRPADERAVRGAFETAVRTPMFAEPIAIGRLNNQAAGNGLAATLPACLNPALVGHGYWLTQCEGAGYPDMRLVDLRHLRSFPVEVKTSSRQGLHNSRLVLSSSTSKLRTRFRPPIHHLMLSLRYRRRRGQAFLIGVRLNFLSPKTRVDVRWEASLTSRRLAVDGVWLDTSAGV